MAIKLYEKIKKFLKENYLFLIGVLVGLFLILFELPFVVYTPGGLVPLNKRIEISDGFKSEGSFNMSYVTMRKGNIPTILFSYLMPNWDIISKKDITIDGESVEELVKLEKLYMTTSINNATIVAYKKANKKIEIKKRINNIILIDDDANTDLLLYDELISADGKNINNIEELRAIVSTKKVHDKVSLSVRRNGKLKDCSAEVYNTSDGLKIGIAFLTTYEYETDPLIEVKTKSSESGSSGGLMLSLAIYNSLIEEDITKGRKIVGTGTINEEGIVGEIDGVKYKLLGAAKNKADMFICPKENYAEAMKVKEEFDLDIPIYQVGTFEETLELLG